MSALSPAYPNAAVNHPRKKTQFGLVKVNWKAIGRRLISSLLTYALLLQLLPQVAIAGRPETPKPAPLAKAAKSAGGNATLDSLFSRATGEIESSFAAGSTNSLLPTPSPTPANGTAIVRHAPSLNGNGRVEGSLRQLTGESVTLNGGAVITNDLQVPGTPTLVLNGSPIFGGTVQGTGSSQPTNYQVLLNGGTTTLGHLVTRTDPITLASVSPPPTATGTRSVTITAAGQSAGDFATLRDLTLNGNVGNYSVPPGTYRNFIANGGSGFVLGVNGASQPSTYNFSTLTLNGLSQLQVIGPINLTLGGSLILNASMGSVSNPAWLNLQLSAGGVTLNGGSSLYAVVKAPAGTVIINGNAQLIGTVACDRLTINGGGLLRLTESALPPVNQAPVVSAGANQTITLPNAASLNGSVSDDGLPQGSTVTASWTKVSGPGTVTFAGPSNAVTTAAFNQAGTYVLRLTASDSLLTSSSDVTITVIPQNHAPTVNAGPDQSITLPGTATLSGSVSDDGLPAGGSLTTAWSKVSGPGTVTFTNPNATVTSASFSVAGTYTLRLTATDSQLSSSDDVVVTVIPQNHAPTVNAGPDQTITLPNAAQLNGTATDDGLPAGSSLSKLWTKVSGPGTVTFTSPTAAATSASFSVAGTYTLRLTASDSQLSSSDDVVVTVNPQNQAPTVNAGPDQTITLPSTANLNGSAGDDGLPSGSTLSTTWTKVSGPGTVTFANANVTVTTASFSVAGTYTLRLTATDSQLSSSDDVVVTVIPQNHAPTVNAGPDQTITLPNAAQLNGTVTDDGLPAGSSLTISWGKVIGPGTVTFTNPNAATTSASFSVAGTYTLRLTASDSQLSSTDDVVVVVSPQNQPPTANAGPDQTITLPATANLNSSAGDDGLPAGSTLTTTWSKVSGPGTVTFGNPNVTVTTAAFSVAGSYVLRLTASDSQLSNSDDIAVTVIPQNQPPTVNAGADQTITLPNTASLNGSATDDGLPSGSSLSKSWTKVSGPGIVTFTNPNAAVTSASFSVAGTYTLRLTASDSQLSSSDDVVVTVIPQNHAPTVDAGPDQTITLPNSANLNGSVSDDGLPSGSSVTSTWSKVSGPGTVTFGNSNVTVTTAAFSVAGSYVLRLTASDSQLSTSDDITITVIPQNHAPAVNAGPDQTITLPNTAQLNGTANDDGLPSGSSLSISWSKVSGPGTVAFGSPNAAVTNATFSVAGTYTLRLTASDSQLSSSDDVVVTVIPQNHAPTVDAGPDQTITLPNSANLNGNVNDDGLPSGSSVTSTWSKVSGPGTVIFGNPNVTVTTAVFSVAGSYVLRLSASDSELTTSDDVVVTVNPQNQPPTVNAGADQSITLPNTASLHGSPTDDGLPSGSSLSVSWSKFSGPGVVTFGDASSSDTTATFTEPGTYVLRITASDSQLSASDDVTITVASANQPPVVNAGADQNIGSCTANLQGTATDDGLPAGNSLTITWSKVSGPGSVIFADAASLNTSASFSAAGNYVLRLTVSDSQLSSNDDVAITVVINPIAASAHYFAPKPYLSFQDSPFRNGAFSYFYLEDFEDHLLNTPGVSANAGGVTGVIFGPGFHDSVDADDGVIDGHGGDGESYFSYDGSSGIKFTFDANVLGSLPTHAGLVWTDGAGDVYFEAFDRHGVSMGLQGPFNPADGVFFDTTAEDRFLGAYNPDGISAIRAINTGGGIEVDHLQYGFGSSNTAPTVDAGPDQSVFAPSTMATLNGSATDDGLPGCTPLTISWSQVSGPATVSFTNANSAVTTATFSALGTYALRLTASDSQLTATDDVTVTVTTNQPPVADFGLASNNGPLQLTTVSYSSYHNDGFETYHPQQLLDTRSTTYWQTASGQVSNQFAVFRPSDGRSALIDRVRLQNTFGPDGTNVHDFEVQVSTATANASDFHSVLIGALPNDPTPVEFVFPGGPVTARFIKLVIVSNYGSSTFTNLSTFQPVSAGGLDSIVSFLGKPNSALNQSPALAPNGGAIYDFSYDGGTFTADPMLGYSRGGWITTSNANQFAIIQLAGGKLYTLDGIKIATGYDSGYGFATGVKDFEIWVSSTTPDPASFTRVLSATVVFNSQLQTFTFPGGPVQAKYVKYVPLNNGGGAASINTQMFDVIAEGFAKVVGSSGQLEYATNPAEAAFDGNSNTFWYGPNGVANNVWVKTSLEDETIHKVSGVRITPLNSYYYGVHGPKDFDIRVSTTTTDDSAFTTVYSGTLSGDVSNNPQEFALANPVDAKYVEFYWKNSYSDSLVAVTELEVLADSAHGSTLLGYSSTSDPTSQAPANALDIDTSSLWTTANGQNTDQWLKLSLPGSDLFTIDHVALMPGFAVCGFSCIEFSVSPKNFELQVSTTDAADASFATVFAGTLQNTATLQHFLFPPVQARYVRLLLRNNYGSGSIALLGFYVYSSDHGSTDSRFVDRSTDSDGHVVSWAWDFGDGGASTDESPLHHYAAAGTYTVSLTVTDDGGLTATHQMTFKASGSALTPNFSFSPVTASEGAEYIRFTDTTELLMQPAGHRVFDFGNGSAVTDLYQATYYPYQFPDSGSFNVTMTIGDDNGLKASVTKPITVRNVPPSVTVEAGKTVLWGESWTNAPHISDLSSIDSQTLHGVWDFGDGQTFSCNNCNNTNATATHAYTLPGVYNATLTVNDKDGGVGSASATYAVNRRPTALIFQSPPTQTTSAAFVIHARLTDTFANVPLSGKPVQFVLNGATFSAVTGADGVAEVSVPLPAGTKIDIVTGTFAGDSLYLNGGGVGVPVTAGGTPPNGTPANAGTNFWLMFPQSFEGSQYLFISAPVTTTGTVSIPSLNFTQNFTVQANSVLKVPLPYTETTESDAVSQHGINVTSQLPVTVYGMNQRVFSSDAFLGLPVNALGRDHYILTYSNMGFAPSSELGVVATENGTTATITPAVTTGTRLAGVPYDVVLNQGQTYLLQNTVPTTAGDLTGSRVTADKPVAVYGAHEAATIPAEAICCADHVVEQLPPTAAWGKRFATIPIATRTKGDFFRLIAAQDDTAIYLNGALTATLNHGQWVERIVKNPTEIIATKPIMVAQLSTSIFYDYPTTGFADPFMMIIPPYSQFLNHYTVSTPPTGFAINYINVVAPTSLLGSITLDGTPIPANRFTPIGVSGYSGAQVPVTIGTHNFDGPASFGVFVYGFNQDEGYGYPGGMNLAATVQSTKVVLAPETLARPINGQACFVATVTNEDQVPLGGRTVNFTVTGANAANSSATTDAAGQAQFCYTGTHLGSDLVRGAVDSASGTASVQWLTDVPNQPPVVNAGADQTITLPVPANLQGLATDDGLPGYTLSVSWSKVSGPGIVTFANSASVSTTATFGAAGAYVLRLTASDTSLSTSDDVQITVNPTPTNQAPTANAGSDQSVAIKGNLIVNPGNEEPLVNGEIPGWVEEQGTTWTQGNTSIAGLPNPYQGQNFFYVGADGAQYAELRQDIDVSAFATSIATGSQQFEFQTWVRALAEFPYPDTPRIIVEFRNALNNGVLGTMDAANGYAINNWYLTETLQAAPVGTGWIRVRLIATRTMGGLNDAYFDAVGLRPVGNTAVNLRGAVTDDGLPYGSSVSANWTQVSGPAAATFTNANAANSGASFNTPGTYVLRLTASDGQASTTDDATITVYAQNQPPVVNGATSQTITLPANATLDPGVSDDGLPQGSSLSSAWRMEQGPGMVTFANAHAASTTASFSTPGFYILNFAVDDSEYTATTFVYVNVNPAPTNQAPMVSAGPDQTISLPTDTVTLNGSAADDGYPAGGSLSVLWTTVSGPGAVNFGTPNAVVTTAQFSVPGTYVLRLTASDGELSTSDDVNVTLTAANQAPTVNAGADQITILSAGAQLNGSASDDGLPTGSNLTTTWSKVSGPGTVTFLNANVTVTGAQFSATGAYVLRLTASDGALSTSDDVTITVIDDVPPPTVQITAPVDDASITESTIVTGSVSGGAWVLEYSLDSTDDQNSRVWTQFASGNGPISNGQLGTIDPTMMLNGLFDIRLSATDSYGQTSRTKVSVIVERNLKVGNFTVSFTDLSIPVAGVPMEVTRTYDSRDKRVGDFGFGWTLGLHNIRVEKSSVLGLKWYETVSQEVFPNYCLEPVGSHAVTVTFPGGKVFKFQPNVAPHCQRNAPITAANISFTPMTGTVGKLEVIGSSDVQIDGSVPGPVNLIGFGSGVDIFNSFVFKFTAEDGTAYVIDQRTGLQSLADLNGNTLTIGAGGIVHSSGKSIVFNRDSFGRIASIVDPNGNSQFYNYDANGDLISYTDNENNTSTYTYDANHRLLTIHDPRGIQPIRNDYDADGRLISHTDGFGKVITYLHDIPNRTETVTDRLGHPTVFEYDERGNVLRKTDARGGVTSSTYDANDNVLTETNALGKTTTYTYDGNDHRTSITDPLGNLTQFTYNTLGRVLSQTDPLGHVTTNTYDSVGNLLTTKDALNNIKSFVYSIFGGQRISMTDALNNTKHYEYTGDYLTKETDPLGHETTFTYDANGNRASQTAKRTNAQGQLETITTTYEYDKLNRLKKTTLADGTFIQVEYNSIGQQSATVDQLGHRTEFTYDDMGRLTKTTYSDGTFEETKYDAEGRRLTSKDRAGHVTSYTYDELGRLTKPTFADGTFTQTSYDAAGQVLTATDARGNITHYEYDDAGRRIKITDALNHQTTYTYYANGNQLSTTDSLGHTTTYQYDNTNHLTRATYADSTFDTIVYDALGRCVAKTDQAGKTTEFTYDALGRLGKVKDALSQDTTFAYDEIGEKTSQTDANNHVTRFEYDQLGRRVKHILPAGQFQTYSYDLDGDLQNYTNFDGKTTTFAYDGMRRLLSKTPDASLSQPTVSFTYNQMGQRATMADASGVTTYTYDARNRLISKQSPFGTLSHTYDDAGNLLTTRSSNENGLSVDYSYDPLSRLSTVKDNNLIALNGGITNYTYDPIGNLQNYQYPNGVRTSYVYNSLDRLTTMTVGTPVTALASYSYTLGAAGNRTAVTELGGRTVNYTYDDLYRLTSESIANDPHGVNGSESFSYDPVGNRLSRSSSIAPVSSQSSTFDANDRLTADGYDNNGNTTAASGNSYAYDFENRLNSMNSGTVTFVYDGDGNRVAKTVGGVTTNYLVDTNNPTGYAQVVDELQNGAVVKSFTYGHERIDQRIVGGSLSFYQTDGHGSVRMLTNSTSAVTDAYDYDAFGNLIYRSGTTANDFLYSGESLDANLGFYYLRARYMNADSGRFLSMDAVDGSQYDPHSLHKYTYVSNNPANLIDPRGEFSAMEAVAAVVSNAIAFCIEYQAFFHAARLILAGINLYLLATNETYRGNFLAGGPEFATTVVADDVSSIAAAPARFSGSVYEASALEPFAVRHATAANAQDTQNLLNGIDPAYFSPTTKFGPAFYTAEDGQTAINEVVSHGGQPTFVVRYDMNLNSQRVLDLTKPSVAEAWGYNSALSYESTQAIAQRASQQGYSVIAYPAAQGAGTNFAVLRGFTEILRPMGIAPGAP